MHNIQTTYDSSSFGGVPIQSQSFDRFQNNNVSSAVPGKALVSPRNGHPVQQQPIQTKQTFVPTRNNYAQPQNFEPGV